jgi:putative endonuclease
MINPNTFYFLYLLASKRNGVLYLGVTSNLPRRIEQHRQGYFSGFTKKYNVHKLVWFEEHTDIREAVLREKAIKRWRRAWKIALIEKANPDWLDLWDEIKGV